jgi:hypothetical protein
VILGFHGSDCEEWRLLGYKNPVRTSQKAHYVSTTELSQLMLGKICSFHGSDYEECRLLVCYALFLVGTDVSDKRIASISKVKRIGELGTTLAVSGNRSISLQRASVVRYR